MPRLRPRISLFSALLLMTIVGMAIIIWLLYAEVAPLRSELRRFRDEVGALTIEDKSKAHAIKVESHGTFTWNWRIWIPAGQAYELRYMSDDIPPKGFPPTPRVMTLHGPDEQWIGHRIRRDPKSGKRMSELVTQQGTIIGSEQNWIGKSRVGETNGVQFTTIVFEPGRTIELMRARYSRKQDNADNDEPADGFMIWLEPVGQ